MLCDFQWNRDRRWRGCIDPGGSCAATLQDFHRTRRMTASLVYRRILENKAPREYLRQTVEGSPLLDGFMKKDEVQWRLNERWEANRQVFEQTQATKREGGLSVAQGETTSVSWLPNRIVKERKESTNLILPWMEEETLPLVRRCNRRFQLRSGQRYRDGDFSFPLFFLSWFLFFFFFLFTTNEGHSKRMDTGWIRKKKKWIYQYYFFGLSFFLYRKRKKRKEKNGQERFFFFFYKKKREKWKEGKRKTTKKKKRKEIIPGRQPFGMEKQSRSNWCYPNRVRLRWGRRESSLRSGLRTSSRTPQGWQKPRLGL